MSCPRCQGLMVASRWRRGPVLWGCLNCGNYVDITIAFNRALATPETVAQRNERIWRRVRHELTLVEAAA